MGYALLIILFCLIPAILIFGYIKNRINKKKDNQSIIFAEWIRVNVKPSSYKNTWMFNSDPYHFKYTTEQLLELFKRGYYKIND
jgi:hypothetical protein